MRGRFYALTVATTLILPLNASAQPKSSGANQLGIIEFRLSEIETTLNAIAKRSRLVLNNYRPDKKSEIEDSYLEIAGRRIKFEIKPVRKKVEGATAGFLSKIMLDSNRFEFFVNSVEMESLHFRSDGSGLQVTALFSEKGAEITSGNPNLFVINWNKPKISAYLKPSLDDGKVTLLVRSIEVGGDFVSECKSLLSRCQGARIFTQDELKTIPKELQNAATRLVTSFEFQNMISSSIGSALDFGEFGRLKIVSLKSGGGKVTMQYCSHHC